MIVVFPGPYGASVHFRPDLLSAEERARGMEVETLPAPEPMAGTTPVLMADKETGSIWYEYVDTPPDPVSEQLDKVKKRLDIVEQKISSLEAKLT